MRPTAFRNLTILWSLLAGLAISPAVGQELAKQDPGAAMPNSLSPDQLVAWCTVVFDAQQRGPNERAKLLQDLGIKRSAYEWRERHVPTFEAEIQAYRQAGIEFFAFWSWHDAMAPLIRKYGIKPQIWLTNPSPGGDTQDERVAKAAEQVLPVVRQADELGLKVALYNHLGWGGDPENLVAVIERLKAKHGLENVGICYNFHHGHHHVAGFDEAMRIMLPHLLCVNLNGVDDESEIDIRDLKQKIRPIGSGKHERQMLQTVLASGYDGPFGILDHRPDLDTEDALRRNLKGLGSMLASIQTSLLDDAAWAFRLPDGNPAWLRITPAGASSDSECPEVRLLWSVGSARPAKNVRLRGDEIRFERAIRWKPGGGDVTKQVVGPLIARLNGEGQIELTFSQVELEDGKAIDDSKESLTLRGVRIPDAPPRPNLGQIRFGEPMELFNGKDLQGWKLSRPEKKNGWTVQEGILVNQTPKKDFTAYGEYGNLVTEDDFTDFELSLEYNVPTGGNSGVYLRGMYEAQVVDRDSKMQGISGPGAVFGRIEPSENAGREGGQWNRYVLTLVDRHITVRLNGKTVIDNVLLEGCTGGGIQCNDALPGPILLQGDHTSVRYRNIVLRPVIRPPTKDQAGQKKETALDTGRRSENPKRPNVLIIYGDDQGSIDMSCFGASDLKTPNMDRLAKQGLRLTQMYSAAPVCSASRVGLLTGRYPARAGQPGNGDLASGEITIAESFRDAGYATGQVGKWHLGRTPTINPAGQGFDSWFGHLEGCIDNFSHFFYWSGPNRHDLWDNGTEIHRPGEYFPQLMVDRCKQFIDQQRQKPWLLYWAFNAPHYPYQGTPEWLEHYKALPTPRREYCAFVSTMDQYIGDVLDYLDEQGLAENTIVIYQPDHGHSTETRAFGGGGNAGPYRGAKFSVFEGGIRVPAVIRFPGALPSGQSRNQFMTSCDWFPTLCQWCGVDLPNRTLDGVSIVDALVKNASLPREQFYWQMGSGADSQWAIRNGNWKLIANARDTTLPQTQQTNGGRLKEKWFLVDLNEDPGEHINLAGDRTEIVDQLKQRREQLVREF